MKFSCEFQQQKAVPFLGPYIGAPSNQYKNLFFSTHFRGACNHPPKSQSGTGSLVIQFSDRRTRKEKKKLRSKTIGQCVSYATTARGDSFHSLTFVYFDYYSPSKITILPSSFPFTWHSVMDPTCKPNQTSITRCGTRFLLVSVIHVSLAPPQNQITKKLLLRFPLLLPQPPSFLTLMRAICVISNLGMIKKNFN